MRSTLSSAVLGAVLICSPVLMHTPARAQLLSPADLQLVDGSEYLSGCAPPSMCDCLVIHVGDVTGTFHLMPLLPPLLPLVEYAVQDIDWQVAATSVVDPLPSVITGSGLYVVDIVNDTHSMQLDLVVDGVDRVFTSGGFVPMTGALSAGSLSIYVYQTDDFCLVDGIQIVSVIVDGAPLFHRGDCNLDAMFDIGDPINILDRLFSPLAVLPPCRDACDVNDDGMFDIADAVYALNNLFAGGPNPAPPFPNCGPDPTDDDLDCFDYPPCG
ncbi:MAG: hypothetical protein KDC38_13140 [Planctomycetes bacterium]|nr:hypothetical protein [Planctomycetota bacterium]